LRQLTQRMDGRERDHRRGRTLPKLDFVVELLDLANNPGRLSPQVLALAAKEEQFGG